MRSQASMILPFIQTAPSATWDLREIFLAQHQRLFRIAFHLTASRHEAEDVVQEVFMRLLERREQFLGNAKLSTWLYRMTVNASLDVLRRFKRRQKRETSFELPEVATAAGGQSLPPAAHSELKEKMQIALARVRKPYRAAIVLRDFEGLAYEEIAEVLRIDKGTVASRLHRGYKKLQKELAALGIDQNYLAD